MKRIITMITLLCCLMPLTACSSGANTLTDQSTYPPPFYIRSLEDFKDALSASSLNDNELNYFLSNNGYPSNILDRTAFNKFIGVFYEIGYPKVDNEKNIQKFTLEYSGYTNHHRLIYEINGMSYAFQYVADPAFVDRDDKDKAISCIINDVEINMYHHLFKDKWPCLVGDIYIEGYRIEVIVRDYSSLDDINFDQFFWQKAQQ